MRDGYFELGALDLPRDELKNVDWYAVSTEKKTEEAKPVLFGIFKNILRVTKMNL